MFSQRHFVVFAVSFPGPDALFSIYNNIFSQHLEMCGFAPPLKKFCPTLVAAALGENSQIEAIRFAS